MEHQVRITKIEPGKVDDFVAAWTAHIARIRRRHGFMIEGAWVNEDTNEFWWILGYDGDDGFEAAEKRYYESEERRAVEDDPVEWIVESRRHVVRKIV